MELVVIIATAITSVLASSGMWSYLQHRQNKDGYEARLLKGLAYTALITQCADYIRRGEISSAEYVELSRMLYEPYKGLGGNGSVDRAFLFVKNLPMTNQTTVDKAKREFEDRKKE